MCHNLRSDLKKKLAICQLTQKIDHPSAPPVSQSYRRFCVCVCVHLIFLLVPVGCAACPLLAFASPDTAGFCIRRMQKYSRKAAKLKTGFVRPIISSLSQLMAWSILQGNVDLLVGLLRGNERHCFLDRTILQFCRQVRSFDTCTFDFTSYHSPVEQFV